MERSMKMGKVRVRREEEGGRRMEVGRTQE